MNQDQNINIQQIIDGLPKAVQDLLYNGNWEEKTAEIGKKYSLTENQLDDLQSLVLLTLIGQIKPEDFMGSILEKLNISDLLSKQLIEDLENRVFESALKQLEKIDAGEKIQNNEKVKDEQSPKLTPVSFGNTTLNIPKEMMKPAFENTALDAQKQNTSIGVPRYATEDIYKPTQPASNPIVNNKLNIVTPGIRPIETKYQKDPYREPLE